MRPKFFLNHSDTATQRIFKRIFSSLCLCAFVVQFFLALPAQADPVMDRVNKSGTIRCGYVSYAPAFTKDGPDGKPKGYNVDLVEEMARRMNLKIEWTFETNWPTMATDLQTNKFDAACVTYWISPTTSRQMLATDPVFYQPAFFAVRAGDTRFDKDIAKIDDPSVSIAVLEGDTPEILANELYPKAKKTILPQTASFPQVFQEIMSKRADVTISAKEDAVEFSKSNPGKIKPLVNQPARLYPAVIQLPVDATQLQNAFNAAILEMQLDGTIEKIMKKYATGSDDYYMVDKPYAKIKGVK